MRPLGEVIALVAVISASGASAHPGGLNAEGCHNNRRTGDYHCHNGGRRSSREPRRDAAPQGLLTAKRPSAEAYYSNCAAARAAGAAPVRRGDPGYSPRLDRDGDGVGCE